MKTKKGQMLTFMLFNQRFLVNLIRKSVFQIMFIFIILFSATGQDTLYIEGLVVNEANEPVSDVSIGVEGSKELPSITNEAGEFRLETFSGNCWLQVSPPGNYKKKRIFLNDRSKIKIYLSSSDMESGDDWISVMGVDMLKRDMVSSFSSVNTRKVDQTPVLSINQYFQGKTSGMYVTNRSGDPGSGAVSFLRGIHSLNANTQPLYIVDGIPVMSTGVFGSNLDGYSYNPLLGIKPLDISNVTIIKDPLITSAYGSKASNGIVFIKTLNPSTTKTSIELDLRTGYSLAPSNQIPQLDAGQHSTLVSEILFSSGLQEEKIEKDYPNLFLKPGDERYIDYQHNTNWQDIIFSNAEMYNLNVNVKGGDEIARYGLSFGYYKSSGIIKNTGYDGYNLRFVSLLNIFTWLKMNASVSLEYNSSQLKESGLDPEASPIMSSLGKSPMLNPFKYDNEGRELTALAEVDELGVSNPQAVIDNFEAKNNNFNFLSTIGLAATIKENMKLYSNFGLTFNVLKEQIFMPNIGMELYYDKEAYNVSKLTNNSLSGFYNNTYMQYKKTINNKHSFSSVTGFNILSNIFELDWGLTKNSHPNDQYRNIQDGAANLREIGGANRTWNWLSGYEYCSYSYKDKYLVTASLSLDGSSRVGHHAANTIKIGVPFGLFYATGMAWRISNESFLKNHSAIEELKLRLTYGRSGNDDIGEKTATNYYETVKYRETAGLVPGGIKNDSLTYETVSQLDGGVDISLWGNRVRSSIDVYLSTTDNMLINTPIEPYFGFNYRPENGGIMQNKGIDFDLFVRIMDKTNFKWDVQASFSTFKNKIVKITGHKLVISIPGAEVVNIEGEVANSFYGYIYEGVYSTTEEAQNAGLVNARMIPYQAGDAIYKDISGPDGVPDKVINDYDKTIIGSSIPDFFGGISNTFTYKRWALNVFVQFVSGNDVFNYVRSLNESMKGLENQSRAVLNRWQYEGQETMIPRAVYYDVPGNADFSTRWIEDGSYLRLKDVSFSYTVPDNFLAFKNARFYVSATNLFTVTRYLGYDPEFAYSYRPREQGIDYGLTPNHRQFIFGIKFGL